MLNITMVAGARPNFMKLAPIVWAIDKAKAEGRDINYQLVYTGSSDDPTLEPSLFEDLGIHRPDVFLDVDCIRLNEITGRVMGEFDRFLDLHPTDVVIVVDDLASTMAVAIVSKKRGVRLAHLVAGTRSFDISMPKEVNRLVIDGLSDLLFTAGMGANSIVTREGVETAHIYMVGNILMDTLRHNHQRLQQPDCLKSFGIADQSYLVLTLNRKILLADNDYLKRLVETVADHTNGMHVFVPVRDLALRQLEEIASSHPNIHVMGALPYLQFGYLTAHAKGVITDSGNVAEEATFNHVPCITLNGYTEHIETVNIGSNVLAPDQAKLCEALDEMIAGNWKKCALPDRWDGRTAERILQILSAE